MRAIIPVAGVGSRLRPHTYTLPKVLLNVAGKPILGHILDKLLLQGITEATIIIGYMGHLVEEYVRSHYDLKVDFVQQNERLGLGHSIWVAQHTFDSDPILIILGDTIFDVNLSEAFSQGVNSLGVKEVHDPRRFGVVELNDRFIVRLVEKPDVPPSNLALVGLYFIKNTLLFKQCLNTLVTENIRTRDEYQLTDALQLMIDSGEIFTTFQVDGWYDCGKHETILSTNRYLLEHQTSDVSVHDCVIIPPVFIAPSAKVSRSVIGPYATIAENAEVIDSVLKNSIIGDNAIVTSSVLDQSLIGNSAVVNGTFSVLNVGDSSEINKS